MGRKIKTQIDWSKDKGNEKGDVVMLAQHARTSLGAISFLGQAPTYAYYANIVNESYEKSHSLHNRVLELPVSKDSNFRHIFDNNLLAEIYEEGSKLTTGIYLMFEHLTFHVGITMFRSRGKQLFEDYERKELKDKLKNLFKSLDLKDLEQSKGYGVLFADIERARHAINHPKSTNIYAVDSDHWDEVPIAWFVSGKHLDACEKSINMYNKLHDAWTGYMETHKIPGEIIIDGPIVFDGYSAPKNRKDILLNSEYGKLQR